MMIISNVKIFIENELNCKFDDLELVAGSLTIYKHNIKAITKETYTFG